MLILLYSLALTLGLLIASPWWLTRMLTTDRYREGLAHRLGRVPAPLRDAARGRKVIWLHAVSVGEVLAATRLVADLEAALGAGWLIAISTTTRTGQKLARDRFGAHRVFYFPLDFAFSTRAYLAALQPAALILAESELWPRLLHECARRHIPTVVVNARVSDRSFARALKFRRLWQHTLGRNVTLFLAQSEQDATRLRTLGAPNVQTTGNLKYDIQVPKENWAAELILEAAASRPIIVAGSTVEANRIYEDEAIISAWRGSVREETNPLLVIAPRHPENFAHLYERVYDYERILMSELKMGVRTKSYASIPPFDISSSTTEVVVLDTIGDLAAVYGTATVAFVGGSLVDKGGHNPLEPAQFGVPVVMGPSFENFRGIVSAMQQADAIRIAHDEEELEAAILELLQNPTEARALGERGRQVFLAQQGATTRATTAILKLVQA